jgi:hypothetical protein
MKQIWATYVISVVRSPLQGRARSPEAKVGLLCSRFRCGLLNLINWGVLDKEVVWGV